MQAAAADFSLRERFRERANAPSHVRAVERRTFHGLDVSYSSQRERSTAGSYRAPAAGEDVS